MQILQQTIPYQLLYPINDKYVKEDFVFFDIETTGLSAQMSYVYLIGCAYYDGCSYQLIQWFSEGINEERDLIIHFFEFIQPYKLLIHYNGSGFDLPFLETRCQELDLPYSFKDIDSVDIYKQIIPYKKRLPLTNLKLKTVESFVGLKRKDSFSGGELIEVYLRYIALHMYEMKKTAHEEIHYHKNSGLPLLGVDNSTELLHSLLLHNAEDVMGLLKIADILSYTDLFAFHGVIESAIMENQLFQCRLKLKVPIPKAISYELELPLTSTTLLVTVEASETEALITVPCYLGELKFFFDNYKDYYYLPYEDTAIHKSIGEYVDKDYRQNAKANNCYVKKEGYFLPQKGCLITPAFREEYKDKITFIEVTDEFLNDPNKIICYLQSLT
ncbi:MAG: ribonuclease H-like domain-containing protein [Clostridiales bacterium]|nr:ribonuclease H-like domain-containing protein [Clostridiales bacterium]